MKHTSTSGTGSGLISLVPTGAGREFRLIDFRSQSTGFANFIKFTRGTRSIVWSSSLRAVFPLFRLVLPPRRRFHFYPTAPTSFAQRSITKRQEEPVIKIRDN